MPSWVEPIINTILPSLVVGCITAIITVRLSLGRFYAERWWERKADAYSRIVEALHISMEYWSAKSYEAETGQTIDEVIESRLREDHRQASRDLKKVTAIGAYIISDEVVEALAKLLDRSRLDPSKCGWFEIYEDEYEAHKKALAEIRALSKKDLRVS